MELTEALGAICLMGLCGFGLVIYSIFRLSGLITQAEERAANEAKIAERLRNLDQL